MQNISSQTHTSGAATANTALNRALLFCGILAGPFYILVGILQILIRPGFDPTRHDLSLLSNGALGWIQITNFLVSGGLVIAGAYGMWRFLRGTRGGTWGPLLLALYGVGLIGAAIFIADPARGFPPGTSVDANTISTHGLLHFVSGGLGFLAFIAACFVFARRFASLGERRWSLFSLLIGILFFAAFFGIAIGSSQGGATLVLVTLAFTAAVILGWAWLSLLSAHLLGEISTR